MRGERNQATDRPRPERAVDRPDDRAVDERLQPVVARIADPERAPFRSRPGLVAEGDAGRVIQPCLSAERAEAADELEGRRARRAADRVHNDAVLTGIGDIQAAARRRLRRARARRRVAAAHRRPSRHARSLRASGSARGPRRLRQPTGRRRRRRPPQRAGRGRRSRTGRRPAGHPRRRRAGSPPDSTPDRRQRRSSPPRSRAKPGVKEGSEAMGTVPNRVRTSGPSRPAHVIPRRRRRPAVGHVHDYCRGGFELSQGPPRRPRARPHASHLLRPLPEKEVEEKMAAGQGNGARRRTTVLPPCRRATATDIAPSPATAARTALDYVMVFVATTGHSDPVTETAPHFGLDVLGEQPLAQGRCGRPLRPDARQRRRIKLFPLGVHENEAGLIDTAGDARQDGAVAAAEHDEDGRIVALHLVPRPDAQALRRRLAEPEAVVQGPTCTGWTSVQPHDPATDPATLPIQRGPPMHRSRQDRRRADDLETKDAINRALRALPASHRGTVDMHLVEMRTAEPQGRVGLRPRADGQLEPRGDGLEPPLRDLHRGHPRGRQPGPANLWQHYTTTSALSSATGGAQRDLVRVPVVHAEELAALGHPEPDPRKKSGRP